MKLRPFKKRPSICPPGYVQITEGKITKDDIVIYYYSHQPSYQGSISAWSGMNVSMGYKYNAKIFRKTSQIIP